MYCIRPYIFTHNLTVPVLYVLLMCLTWFQMEYFQDDLFPDTRVSWEPSLDSSQWFSGCNKEQKRISMRPPDMKPCKQLYSAYINIILNSNHVLKRFPSPIQEVLLCIYKYLRSICLHKTVLHTCDAASCIKLYVMYWPKPFLPHVLV